MTEKESVYWALQQFTFAVKLVVCCFNAKIDFNIFKPKVTFNIQNDVTFDVPEWDIINQEELNKAVMNQLMASLAACTIAVDEALSIRHGKSSFRNWEKTPSDLNALREIIFLIRSAYAHKMPDVYWNIDPNRNKAIYTVNTPDGQVQLDARDKHGTKLKFPHFGGLKGYLHLVNFASDVLS
ncbi:hypothetical protein K1X76_00345 [bacterium]|nr:hypothetical protein [bacterium]